MHTLQSIFNTAYLGLASQGFEYSITGAGCAYRGNAGRRCAVGWLIPDEIYESSIEGGAVDSLEWVLSPLGLWRFKGELSSLQHCHDRAASPADMRERLADFAARHGLTIPELPTTDC